MHLAAWQMQPLSLPTRGAWIETMGAHFIFVNKLTTGSISRPDQCDSLLCFAQASGAHPVALCQSSTFTSLLFQKAATSFVPRAQAALRCFAPELR
jgi:hypothetical protein